MANQFLNAQVYANSMLLLLKNNLVFGRLVDGQFKDQVTDQNGLTINVKRPPRFVLTSGATLQAQDLVTGTAPVTVDQYSNVHISVGDLEYVQSYNALMQNETMKSAASTLAHGVDKFISGKTLQFASWIAGTAPGTVSGNASDPTKAVSTPSMAMAAHTRLMQNGAPDADIKGVMNFDDAQSISGTMLGQFLPANINAPALERSRIPVIGTVDWYASQQIPSLTAGTRTQGDGASTGYQIDGGTQNVNYRDVKGSAGTAGMTQSLILKSSDNALTIKLGEVFTIQNVYAWDWRAQQATKDLQQFTVIDDGSHPTGYTTSSGGAVTVKITPPIIVQGTNDGTDTRANTAFATVGTVPADSAYVKWAGAASAVMPVRSAFHKRAISLVSARLHAPFSGVSSFAVDKDTGIAIRYWRASDVATGQHIHRWDMIYGASVMDNFLGTRVCGT